MTIENDECGDWKVELQPSGAIARELIAPSQKYLDKDAARKALNVSVQNIAEKTSAIAAIELAVQEQPVE